MDPADGEHLWTMELGHGRKCDGALLFQNMALLVLTTSADTIGLQMLDLNGELLWSRENVVDAGTITGALLHVNASGAIVVAGNVEDEVWVAGFDAVGDLVWTYEKNTLGYGQSAARALTSDVDGNILVAGWEFTDVQAEEDLLLLKLDSTGNLIWTWVEGHYDNDVATSIGQLSDGTIIIAGYADDTWSVDGGGYLGAISPQGTTLWEREAGGGAQIYVESSAPMAITADDHIVVSYTSHTSGMDRLDYFEPNGDRLWSVPSRPYAKDIAVLEDGTILVTFPYLSRAYRSTGQRLWENTYAVQGTNYGSPGGWQIVLTTEGDLITAGRSGDNACAVRLCVPPPLVCMEASVHHGLPNTIPAIRSIWRIPCSSPIAGDQHRRCHVRQWNPPYAGLADPRNHYSAERTGPDGRSHHLHATGRQHGLLYPYARRQRRVRATGTA
jgi:hypothetical protein